MQRQWGAPSRWVDGYFAWGWEGDKGEEGVTHTDQMTEVGVKFRFNLGTTPLKFLRVLGTDFWGLRLGVKNKGIFNWSEMGYALEFGAGSGKRQDGRLGRCHAQGPNL